MVKPKTIFVTGASGYIAKNIVLQLLEAGYHVRGSVRSQKRANEVRAAVAAHLGDASDLDNRLDFVELDLTMDEGWDNGLAGVDALFHTASPFPLAEPKDEQDLIRPAVDGTLRALKAAKSAGIDRVVLTSSVVAMVYTDMKPGKVGFDETDWSDLSNPRTSAYAKSKTLAEKAAWEFVKEAPDIRLTAINPGMVLGPALDGKIGSSLSVLQRVMNRQDPALPQLSFAVADVRDIARMHILALENPKTIGKRLMGVAGSVWFSDIARILKKNFPDRKVVTRVAPNWFIRLAGLFDSSVRGIVPLLGEELRLNNQATRTLLDMEFISSEQTIKDAADFLIDQKLVK